MITVDPAKLADLASFTQTKDLSRLDTDKIQRVLFELLYDMESRMRVRESRPSITKAQYKNALIALYQSF